MSSLTEQMEQIEKQKRALALRIDQEKQNKMQENYGIQRLENLNNGAVDRHKSLKRRRRRSVRESYEIDVLYHTIPRFSVILEILERQSKRIHDLEAKLSCA